MNPDSADVVVYELHFGGVDADPNLDFLATSRLHDSARTPERVGGAAKPGEYAITRDVDQGSAVSREQDVDVFQVRPQNPLPASVSPSLSAIAVDPTMSVKTMVARMRFEDSGAAA